MCSRGIVAPGDDCSVNAPPALPLGFELVRTDGMPPSPAMREASCRATRLLLKSEVVGDLLRNHYRFGLQIYAMHHVRAMLQVFQVSPPEAAAEKERYQRRLRRLRMDFLD